MGWQDAPIVGSPAPDAGGPAKAYINIGKPKPEQPAWQSAPLVGGDRGGQHPATVGDRAQELAAAATQQPSVGGSVLATTNGLVEGIPVVGPLITKASDFALSQTLGRLEGKDPGQFMQEAQDARQATNDANPVANIAGQVGGTLGSFIAGGEVPAIADALGGKAALSITAPRLAGGQAPKAAGALQRVVSGGVSNAGLAGADALARGEDPGTALKDAAIGAVAGAAIPAAGELANWAAKPIAEKLQPVVNSITQPAREALRRVGAAVGRDRAAGQDVLTSADTATAANANIPLVNADRGGETTRALARSVANQSPEARATLDKFSSDRFAGQGGRAENFIRRIFGGSADDLGYQQRLRAAADKANDPAYKRAYGAPGAQAMWNTDLQQLMQSPRFRAAARSAESRGADRAAVSGFPAVRNPFVFGANGSVSLKPGVTPSLQFWDQVKRNLDGMIEGALRGANPDKTLVADLTALKGKLTGSLDAAVPEYRSARAGAAAFFGADDALDAGRKFAGELRNLPEARQAFMKMNPAEKQAFAIGYASSLIDKIRTVGDRTNVINSLFKTPAQRQAIEMILGAGKAKQVEAYVRVEDLADKLRGALGNSTTARQLVDLGIGAGAGYTFGGHDWQGLLTGALAARGIRYGLNAADQRVMQIVAKTLTADDPALIDKAVQQAQQSPALLKALERMEGFLSAPARAGAYAVAAQ